MDQIICDRNTVTDSRQACGTAPRTLYLDCAGGISGDMYVASLLDLGADRKLLEDTLSSLNLPGYRTEISEVVKNGIRACDFNVILDTDNHDHDMAYLHPDRYPQAGYAEGHESSHDHAAAHSAVELHEGAVQLHEDAAHSAVEHCHEHHSNSLPDTEPSNTSDEHHHPHHHHGRSLPEIEKILRGGNLSSRAQELALKIFRIIAEAEGKVHGKAPEEVHFHEVGAVDSIVDIAAAAVCTDSLGIEKVILSPLTEGCGTVRCQHGILPIPVPAVTAIVESHHLALHKSNIEGELVTPTGAAIAAALDSGEQLPGSFVIEKTGIGAGKRDYASCGILRAMLIRSSGTEAVPTDRISSDLAIARLSPAAQIPADQPSVARTPASRSSIVQSTGYKYDEVLCLESNMDDVTGEALGFVEGLLLEAGALDVWETPIYMKKSRPAWQISTLCREEQLSLMENILFANTTTIGIRISRRERATLPREIRTVDTPWGPARVKVVRVGSGAAADAGSDTGTASDTGLDSSSSGEHLRFYPEYESIAALSRTSGIGYSELWHRVKVIAENQ